MVQTYPQGQLLSAPITNGSPTALFGTHIDFLGVGGYRVVATLADRDGIVTKTKLEYDDTGSGQRRHLMLVAVSETEKVYIHYVPGFTTLSNATRLAALQSNAHWMELGAFFQLQGSGLTADQIAAIQAANASSKKNPFLTLADLSGATGGDTISGFTQEVGKFTITTDQGTFVTDLNTPTTSYLSGEILRDPEFNIPFIDFQSNGYSTNAPGWLKTHDWYQSGGTANIAVGGSPQCFLFQDVFMPTQGLYEVRIKANSITGAGVQVLITAQGVAGTPVMYQGGDYVFYFTSNQGTFRFHLLVDQSVTATANIESCSLRQVQVGAVYGDDKFVHLTGSETIRGFKTLTDGIEATGGVYMKGHKAASSFVGPFNLDCIQLGESNVYITRMQAAEQLEFLGARLSYTAPGTGRGFRSDNTGSVYADGDMYATYFRGDGSQLTNLPITTPIYYSGTGQNVDGAMTQKAITDALFTKQWSITEQTNFYLNSAFSANTLPASYFNKAVLLGFNAATPKLILPTPTLDDLGKVLRLTGGGPNGSALQLSFIAPGNPNSTFPGGADARENDITSLLPQTTMTLQVLKVERGTPYRDFIGGWAVVSTDATSQLTHIVNAAIYTAQADGVQTVPLGKIPRGLVSVVCQESGTLTATRTIWEPYCTSSYSDLTITADAGIKTGDKILVKYHY